MIFNPQFTNPADGSLMGTGWIPPFPDRRDYSENTLCMKSELLRCNLYPGVSSVPLPETADLSSGFPPVNSQGALGACTAHAIVSVVEYFQKAAFMKSIKGSRLFNYKTSRRLVGLRGDTGCFLRTSLASLALFGIPPEKYWPYTTDSPKFDEEPPAFVFSIADNYEALKYFCHDAMSEQKTREEVLLSVKKYIAAGIPAVFGFYLFPSYNEGDEPGTFPWPKRSEKAEGGHAVVAVGYDDNKIIFNKNVPAHTKTNGALLIRNSWGPAFGVNGYGYLPYRYVLEGLAVDFWSLLKMEWLETDQFGL